MPSGVPVTRHPGSTRATLGAAPAVRVPGRLMTTRVGAPGEARPREAGEPQPGALSPRTRGGECVSLMSTRAQRPWDALEWSGHPGGEVGRNPIRELLLNRGDPPHRSTVHPCRSPCASKRQLRPARASGRSSSVAYSRITSSRSASTCSCPCEDSFPPARNCRTSRRAHSSARCRNAAIHPRTNIQAHQPPTPHDANREGGDEPLRQAARKPRLNRLEHRHASTMPTQGGSKNRPTARRFGDERSMPVHQTARSHRPRPRLA